MKNFKFGFTLAEVLITLAIIGIVAALTIPTLLANYQKKEWTTKLIKTHAEITQAIKLMMANSNTSSVSETKAWSSMTENCTENLTLSTESCARFRDDFMSYFPGSSLVSRPEYKIGYLGGDGASTYPSTHHCIKLSNGAIIINSAFYKEPVASAFETSKDKMSGFLIIDLNGDNQPNVLGRDSFVFRIYDDGTIDLKGSNRASLYSCGDETCTWNSENRYHNCRPDLETSRGEGCAARIIETGKMDY